MNGWTEGWKTVNKTKNRTKHKNKYLLSTQSTTFISNVKLASHVRTHYQILIDTNTE